MKNTLFQIFTFVFLCYGEGAFTQENYLFAFRTTGIEKPARTSNDSRNAQFQDLEQYLGKRLEYPATARDNGIEGVVVATAIIDPNGKVLNVEVVRGLGFGCDETVISLINHMPEWEPALENGVPVGQKVYIPVRFKLR